MTRPARDPLAVRVSLGLLRSIRSLVPTGIRHDWLREWEAEIRYRWSTLNRGGQTRWQDHADVVRRSTGAISDAAWLRQQFTADHDIMRDVQYALRLLRRRPVMSALAVLVLAIGIGGTVSVFSVVDTLLLRERPYREPDRIVTIWLTNREHPEEREGVAPGAFLDWHDRSESFSHIAGAAPESFDYFQGAEPATLIYGIVSFATAQRTREIGVRVVVGGSARDILTLVFSEGALRVGVGILVGLAGSLAATRVVGALLYEVSPTDPLTLGGTAAALAVVALLACYWPARRATKVDPLIALRAD